MKELDKKRWVNTADVVEFLKSDPDREHEFSRKLHIDANIVLGV